MKILLITAALGALALSGAPAEAQVGPAASIVVRGHGSVEAAPDTFEMTAEVHGRGADQAEAVRTLAITQAAVTDAVSALEGLTAAKVTTGLPAVTALYGGDCHPGNRTGCTPTGYVATLEVKLEGRPAERGGDAVSLAAERGARNARLVRFSLQSDAPFQREATQRAFADARRQADDIARASGQRIGRMVLVEEAGQQDLFVYGLYEFDANYGASSYVEPQTPISLTPGAIEIQTHLQVTFEIE